MRDIDLKELVFQNVVRVSRHQFDRDPGEFTAAAGDTMREALAHFIQHKKIEKRFGDDLVEARLDLYVATPDEFWAAVNNQAEQIAFRCGHTLTNSSSRIAELEDALRMLIPCTAGGPDCQGPYQHAKRVLNGK